MNFRISIFLWGTGFEELGIAATFLDDNFDGEHDDKRWNGVKLIGDERF